MTIPSDTEPFDCSGCSRPGCDVRDVAATALQDVACRGDQPSAARRLRFEARACLRAHAMARGSNAMPRDGAMETLKAQ